MAKSKFNVVRYFLAAACITGLMISSASAESIDISKIPQDQAEKIRSIVQSATPSDEELKAKEINDRVEKYRDIGRNLAASFKATAEEMGMTEREFGETAFGKFSYFWIAWELWFKETSNTLANVLLGLLWWLFAFAIWLYAFKRICLVDSTRTEKIQRTYNNDQGVEVKEDIVATTVDMQDISDGDVAGYRFVFLLIALVISIPGFVLIS